jgi:hypothetical protein
MITIIRLGAFPLLRDTFNLFPFSTYIIPKLAHKVKSFLRYIRARSHKKVLFITECRAYVLVQVFNLLSRCLFSLEFLSLGRLGVVASVLEFLIEALLDYYVLELGHRPL